MPCTMPAIIISVAEAGRVAYQRACRVEMHAARRFRAMRHAPSFSLSAGVEAFRALISRDEA